jgi:alpha-ketoglutarate-dependent taurine dioxygenase
MKAAPHLLDDRGVTPHPAPLVVPTDDASATLALLPDDTIAVDAPAFVQAAARAGRLLPPDIHDAVCAFADEPPASGALVLRGLPVGDVPPTPARPQAPTSKDHISEFVLLTVGRRLGQPVGYAPEHGGGLVQNLVPTPDAVGRQTSTSSGVQLAFHTETAFHPHRSRYLLLLCLRGDPAGHTLLCSVPHAAARLPEDAVQVLRQPRFDTGIDESFGRSTRRVGPFAVLAGDPARPFVTFDADLTAGLDDEANDALALLREAVDACFLEVTLETGDLLVVDNAVTVHGRSSFPARFDGTDRWLQRVFVVPDLVPSGAERQGRVITTTFD